MMEGLTAGAGGEEKLALLLPASLTTGESRPISCKNASGSQESIDILKLSLLKCFSLSLGVFCFALFFEELFFFELEALDISNTLASLFVGESRSKSRFAIISRTAPPLIVASSALLLQRLRGVIV